MSSCPHDALHPSQCAVCKAENHPAFHIHSEDRREMPMWSLKEAAGVKYDQEKPIMALLPAEALEEEAWVWTFGAKKYGYWNWKKGLVYTRIISAILRHTMAIMKGEDIDPESGRLHAAHIRCCAGMLISFQLAGRKDLDDREVK